MSTVGFLGLMRRARENGEAVPAFNIDNLESAIAVSEAMKETGKSVIVQTIPRTLAYGGVSTYPHMMKALMAGNNTDYCMHLDHGNSKDLCVKCANIGFSSVMIDGSALPFGENAALTADIKRALPKEIPLEAELGAVGGKEETEGEIKFTDPEEAAEFISITKCDSLAIGVGNAHGIYRGEPDIKVDLIRKIAESTNSLLVLHGASGLKDDVIRACIEAGIAKINFATELRLAFTAGVKKGLLEYPDCYDPKIYMRTAIDEIKKVVLKKMSLCMRI